VYEIGAPGGGIAPIFYFLSVAIALLAAGAAHGAAGWKGAALAAAAIAGAAALARLAMGIKPGRRTLAAFSRHRLAIWEIASARSAGGEADGGLRSAWEIDLDRIAGARVWAESSVFSRRWGVEILAPGGMNWIAGARGARIVCQAAGGHSGPGADPGAFCDALGARMLFRERRP